MRSVDKERLMGRQRAGSEIVLPLRTDDVVAYARARERAATQTFRENGN